MSPDRPSEPTGGGRRWSPTSREEDGAGSRTSVGRRRLGRALRQPQARGRRVKRTIRHVDPWSVLRLSVLFYAAVFLIVCVASGVLLVGARASGVLDNAEEFITSAITLGECDPLPGTSPPPFDATLIEDGSDCPPGYELVGGFHFNDARILLAFAFGGIVLVLAGSGANVVIALLFNLMSDLTGGLQLWVVEDAPRKRREPPDAGSPPIRYRD